MACKNCAWWDEWKSDATKGDCVGGLPERDTDDDNRGRWPWTLAGEWCGQSTDPEDAPPPQDGGWM